LVNYEEGCVSVEIGVLNDGKVFYQGESKDCRERVKALSVLRMKKDGEENVMIEQTRVAVSDEKDQNNGVKNRGVEDRKAKGNIWAKYVTNSDDENNFYY